MQYIVNENKRLGVKRVVATFIGIELQQPSAAAPLSGTTSTAAPLSGTSRDRQMTELKLEQQLEREKSNS